MREQLPQPKRSLAPRTQGHFRWPANKYSYQNIFLFLQLKKAVEKNKKITCKVLNS